MAGIGLNECLSPTRLEAETEGFFDAAGAECRHTPGGPALCGGRADGGHDYLTQDEGGGAAAPDLITALSQHVVLLELAPYRTQPQHQAASTQKKT